MWFLTPLKRALTKLYLIERSHIIGISCSPLHAFMKNCEYFNIFTDLAGEAEDAGIKASETSDGDAVCVKDGKDYYAVSLKSAFHK